MSARGEAAGLGVLDEVRCNNRTVRGVEEA